MNLVVAWPRGTEENREKSWQGSTPPTEIRHTHARTHARVFVPYKEIFRSQELLQKRAGSPPPRLDLWCSRRKWRIVASIKGWTQSRTETGVRTRVVYVFHEWRYASYSIRQYTDRRCVTVQPVGENNRVDTSSDPTVPRSTLYSQRLPASPTSAYHTIHISHHSMSVATYGILNQPRPPLHSPRQRQYTDPNPALSCGLVRYYRYTSRLRSVRVVVNTLHKIELCKRLPHPNLLIAAIVSRLKFDAASSRRHRLRAKMKAILHLPKVCVLFFHYRKTA